VRNALTELATGTYRGLVTGLESGECFARIEVRRIPGGCLAIDYEATSERAGLQHADHTVVAPDGLYVAIMEMPGVSFFAMTEPGRFALAAAGPCVMEIHASFTDGQLTWAWHWAEAGNVPKEIRRPAVRSNCRDLRIKIF
jgi:hypothetical protein